MENIKIKNYYNKMSEDAKIILVNILADNLIYLHHCYYYLLIIIQKLQSKNLMSLVFMRKRFYIAF